MNSKDTDDRHLRYHIPHFHLSSTFGDDWFGQKAEYFARFFGTPTFLIGQTLIVAVWIVLNVTGVTKFDIYPFILLNLAFSLQAAYAAPLILLAQTRQADRDKAHTEADAQHREDLATAAEKRQIIAEEHAEKILELLEQNTKLTMIVQDLSRSAEERQILAESQSEKILELLEQNTRLTMVVQELTQGMEVLTREVRNRLLLQDDYTD